MSIKKLSKIFAFFIMLIPIFSFAASCDFYNGNSLQTMNFTFGDVYVQRDTPPGTLIGGPLVVSAPFTGAIYYGCTQAWTLTYSPGIFTTPTSYQYYYETNIPGVAIYVYTFATNYAANQAMSGTVSMTARLMKTSVGAVGSGRILDGTVRTGTVTSPEILAVTKYNIYGTTIHPVACSITTPTLNFPIGNIPASSFGSTVGYTPPDAVASQNLGLNCDLNANINVTLTGSQNPDAPTNTSVLALSGQGSAGVAKGVGVQILYNDVPLVLDDKLVLKKSNGGQETFPLKARYYQTKTSVTTGTANATATLNLTYE